ncbi:MAG: GatB/YqeY domain-containing protein [Candidatus Omnitrophica bacterium]|nr:GatB/YqeY domain-containing protein [Candidatus Omnitrophota bacterium]
MMLEDKIYKDYVDALKGKNRPKAEFLSFIRAELKNSAIELKKDKLDDNEVLNALKKQKKRLEESYEMMQKSQRADVLDSLKVELKILEEYLPRQLSDSELTSLVEQAIKDTGASSIKDMGRVMKEILAKAGGSADSKKVSEIVKTKLATR